MVNRICRVCNLRTLLIIPCTDRKRLEPREDLRARNLAAGTAREVASEWIKRVATAKPKKLHGEVYCGRAYREAIYAAKELSAELAVISAGLGVVRANRRIPAYSLTVSSGNEDTILDKITSGEARPDAWWRALKLVQDEVIGLHDVVRGESAELILLALSASYARLVRDDLMNLSVAEAKRFRVFGAGIAEHLPPQLAGSVMPYDVRLNGPDSPIPGTMSDFASRALHHFAKCLKDRVVSARCADDDRQILATLMKTWRLPDAPIRQRMTDDEVVHFIVKHWEKTGGRSGVSLRNLRDSGNACEQSRFRDLFQKARNLRQGREGSTA